MKYFNYNHAPNYFIGMAPEEILGTVNYYREERGKTWLPVPSRWNLFSKERIKTLEEISIDCFFPMGSMHQFIDAEIREGFELHINANAFAHVRQIAENYEAQKRGSLYKFPVPAGMWFLPEYVMQGMHEYDWKQHEAQVNEWLASWGGTREKLAREHNFGVKADPERPKMQRVIVCTRKAGDA